MKGKTHELLLDKTIWCELSCDTRNFERMLFL